MNQPTGSRPLPPPPPSTLGKTKNDSIAVQKTVQKAKVQDTNKKTAATSSRVQSSRPKRSAGQPSLEYIIKKAYSQGYSDIHLGVEEVPRMRDRGEMALTEYPKTDLNTFMSWIHEVLTDEEVARFKRELEFDGATQYEFARVRINIFDTLRGPALVMRLIPLKILTMEQLGLPPVFQDISDAHKGLVLVTGPRSE